MKRIFLTPGPTELYFTVEDHLKQAFKESVPSISHRSTEFKKIYASAIENLRELLSIPDSHSIVFTSSATEIWERLMQNINPKKPSFYVNGAFSEKFYSCSMNLGFDSNRYDIKNSSNISIPEPVVKSDFIGITQNETSIGMSITSEEIAKLKTHNPNSFLAVDMVSALPYYEPDYESCDSIYFSVQKGFGLPAGLGVWIIRKDHPFEAKQVSPHRNILNMIKASENYQTMETPNVLNIYLLEKVTEDKLRRGLKIIRQETEYKSALIYHTLMNLPYADSFIKDERFRSKTTIVAELSGIKSGDVIKYLKNYGLVIGKGYGENADNQIRIANFPGHSKEIVEHLVDRLSEFEI